MRVAIVGSRGFPALTQVSKYVHALSPGTEVVSGGAKGVDETAAKAALACGLTLTEYLPEWDKYGKKAGFIRNGLIVGDADKVVAFWDGESRGTLNTIKKAVKAGKPVEIYGP